MSNCTVRRGFLTLSACGEPAAGVCRTCGRPACAEHLVRDLTGGVCTECGATQHATDEPTDTEDWGTDSWRYGYRDRFYQDSGYRPPSADGPRTGALATGALAAGGTFDDRDRESFDPPTVDAGGLLEEDTGPSLFDS
ncbi:hypothetical protein [uncultured Thiodictyon sp.]|uniref:hypothetical protein n=1 Tax=uncultured Thiodictyon sp. TaxID=1846217 RepID=UPI0025EB189C|nr:hypothetical protein [uncultured Thiodictyon sp.]